MPNLKHPQRGFLDLPSHVRQFVYHYLGLTDKVIDLSSSYDEVVHPGELQDDPWVDYLACRHCLNDVIVKREDYHPMEEYWYCHDESKGRRSRTSDADCELEHCFKDDSHFQLLFTCKTLYAEIQELVYKENRFILDRGTPTGFQRFMKLNASSVRALTHLTIRLDGEPPETMDLSDHWTRTSALRSLKHYSRYGKQAYKEWYALVARLRESGIVPRQLNFFLIALVPDTKEAIFVLRPLQSLPTLRTCGIWLNHRRIPDLAAFIKDKVEELTRGKAGDVKIDDRVDKEKIPFRYLDLPPEIRCRILSFTDLCASPHLEWKPINFALDHFEPPQKAACDCHRFEDYLGKGAHIDGCMKPCIEITYSGMAGLEWEPDHRKHCCACSLDAPTWDRPDCKVNSDPYVCILDCPSHSSYIKVEKPVWKPSCHPLFLVSRQVRQDAIPVFFKTRKFVITSRGILPLRHLNRYPASYQPWTRPLPLPRTELSLFLSCMPKQALRHIRRLEWLLSSPETYRQFPRKAYFDYLDTIELMIQAMTLGNLTLIINVRAAYVRDHDRDKYIQFIWPGRNRRDVVVYDTILKPLCRLGEHGLKNCWLYLRMTRTARNAVQRRDISEKIWEKRIMGNQQYDAYEHGKPQEERIERTTGYRSSVPGGIHARSFEVYDEYIEGPPSWS